MTGGVRRSTVRANFEPPPSPVCPPMIVYLADLDNDGRAEVREVLYEGFKFEVLERGGRFQ